MVSGALKLLRPLAFVLCAALVSGCATNLTNAGYDTADPTDACRTARQDLTSYQDYFTRAMFEGAALGALGGALMGGLIGGNTQGALIGAGAGAVVGGTVGYYSAKQRANTDQASLTRSVYQDVSTENAQIDGVAGAFGRLRDCRFMNAQAVKSDYAAGRLTQAQAQLQLSQIRTRFQQDITFAESLGARMNERGREYQSASDELVKLDPAAQQQVAAQQSQTPAATPAPAQGQATRPAPQRRAQPQPTQTASAPPPQSATGVAQLTESNQLKRKALADDLDSAKVAANTQFELDGKITERQAGQRAA
jgi:outer membrane lipoprotein SlyB